MAIYLDNSKILMVSDKAAASADCCCNFVYKKCSDDTVYGYSDTDLGDYIWHVDSSTYIKLYSDGKSSTADDMSGCVIDPSKASCVLMNFSDFDFGFDVANDAAAACWVVSNNTTWNGTDLTLTGTPNTKLTSIPILKALGSANFRIEWDVTGWSGTGMPAAAGKSGWVFWDWHFSDGKDVFFDYRINGSAWEGRTGGTTGDGLVIHETITTGVPSTPFTVFLERVGTVLTIGLVGQYTSTYAVTAGATVVGTNDDLQVQDGSTGFSLAITVDEMRFTP